MAYFKRSSEPAELIQKELLRREAQEISEYRDSVLEEERWAWGHVL